MAVIVPKAEGAAALPHDVPVLPVLETAAAIAGARALCAHPAVVRPVFGSVDLAAQLGVDHRSHEALRHARSAVVPAAAGCAGPVEGVTIALADEAAPVADLDHAVRLGFTGKLCLHPRLVEPADRRLRPAADEAEWARAGPAAGRGRPGDCP